MKRQYIKNVGRELKVLRKDKVIVQGLLKSADDERIVIETAVKMKGAKNPELKEEEIQFSEIEKATVMVSFK